MKPQDVIMDTGISITDYQCCFDEDSGYNPYLREVMSLIAELRVKLVGDYASKLSEHRSALIAKYAFSIPTIEVLRIIALHTPLVEIGAGSGYWAMCLASLGADIIAFDARVPGENNPWDWQRANAWHDDTWFAVEEGDARTAGLYPERTLFLCWPPPENSMAIDAAIAHRESGGRRLIFLGSEFSCAEANFFMFMRNCRVITKIAVPSWPKTREVLWIVEYNDIPGRRDET